MHLDAFTIGQYALIVMGCVLLSVAAWSARRRTGLPSFDFFRFAFLALLGAGLLLCGTFAERVRAGERVRLGDAEELDALEHAESPEPADDRFTGDVDRIAEDRVELTSVATHDGAEVLALNAPALAPRPWGLTYGGHPEQIDPANPNTEYTLLENQGYEVGYSETRRDPLWAAYRVEGDTYNKPKPRPKRFRIDDRTTSQLVHEDYSQGDDYRYDRGHMAPNYAIATRFGTDAQLETFLMSNICPQRSTLNQQTWRALEHLVAEDYSHDFERVWVITGPVFSAVPRRLNKKAAIPSAFYTIVIDEEEDRMRVLAVSMKQSVRGVRVLRDHVLTVRELEEVTGLNFFPALPKAQQNVYETTLPDEDWELDTELRASFEHD